MNAERPSIFVSCGQYSGKEKQLGNDICSLLKATRPDVVPYFAENQSSVEGLSNHVLKALYRAAGFICVMHRRGDLTTPDGKVITRGSVWIEQEIAIMTLVSHTLGRSVPIFFYKESGVTIEGIRSVLLMNSRVEFTDEAKVLKDLKAVLPSTTFVPFNSYDLIPIITHRRIAGRSSAEHHVYELIADVKNTGTERITDFEIRVYFPRAFLNSGTSLLFLKFLYTC